MTLTKELDWIGRYYFMKKVLYLSLGLFFTLLGIIGAFLPVMPTTVFLIGALFCFTQSSPRLENWLLQHPKYGPSLVAWRKQCTGRSVAPRMPRNISRNITKHFVSNETNRRGGQARLSVLELEASEFEASGK